MSRPVKRIAAALVAAISLAPATALGGDGGMVVDADTLTHDIVPERRRLADRGVRIRAELTGYYQARVAGSPRTDAAPAGRFDALVDVDTARAGGWAGGGLHTHLEYRVGDPAKSRGRTVLPVNAGLALPLLAEGEWVATSLYLSQRLGPSTVVLAGKINPLDLIARDPFFGGWGVHGFMNIAFVAPPAGVMPAVFMGAMLNHAIGPWRLSLVVSDPEDKTDSYSLRGLFEDGFDASATALWTGTLGGRASYAGITAAAKTKAPGTLTSFGLPPELVAAREDRRSSNVTLQAGHLLQESIAVPGRGLGVYARAGLGGGDANPIRASFAGGFAGHGIVPGRPRDSFGIGYAFFRFDSALADLSLPALRFDDEHILEVFYSASATRWLRVTADLQAIRPATPGARSSVVAGMRVSLLF